MKTNKINITLALILTILIVSQGCRKSEVSTPDFDVQPNSLSVKVGDTIKYTFQGYADNISYYSGEAVSSYPTLLGYRYQYKDRTYADGKAFMQFSSLLQNAGQQKTLTVLASTNFTGTYNAASIAAATWTDITSRFNLSTGTPATAVPTGLVDISDFKGQAVYFAFKYTPSAGSIQPKWTINNLALTYYATGADTTRASRDTFTVATLNPLWKNVNVSTTTLNWSISTSQLQITGGNATAPATETWAISGDLYLDRVPTDKSVPIKTYTDKMFYQYAAKPYSRPGTYSVTFVASNANSKSAKEVVKQFIITVSK